MNSVQMWLSGCKRELFPRFNHLGWNLCMPATMRCLDQVVSKYDAVVGRWKQCVEKTLKNEQGNEDMDCQSDLAESLPCDVSPINMSGDFNGVITQLEGTFADGCNIESTPIVRHEDQRTLTEVSQVELDDTLPYADGLPIESTPIAKIKDRRIRKDIRLSGEEIQLDNGLEEQAEEYDFCGYTLCFDNVNQKIGVRHERKNIQTTQYNMVQLYAVKDRIPCLDLSDEPPAAENIRRIGLQKILPSKEDEDSLHQEMETMVQRILILHMPIFKDLSTKKHIKHRYSKESAQKSEMVPLGVLDKDETKTADMVYILSSYNRFIPEDVNGDPVVTILYGDGLSCERAADGKGAVVNCDSKWDRLEGIEPCAQEWHKRLISLQDAFDELFDGKSAREKGTLYHLKQAFNHRKVNKEVKQEFNHCYEFFSFVTEVYVVLAAMHKMGIVEVTDKPAEGVEGLEERQELLLEIAKWVVDLCFERQNIQAVINSSLSENDSEYGYCFCNTEQPGFTMIYCENKKCKNGNWFHLTCIEMEPEEVPEGAWYCCRHCLNSANPKKVPTTRRFIDGKREYVKGVLWHGLNGIVRRDAIRENDGERITRHWKLDMMSFYKNHHYKYFILGVNLLCQLAGSASPRIRHQLKWNRTVNPKGGDGNNLAMDLQMEFFNREYKESSKESAGRLTEATVARHSRLVGTGKRLSELYALQVAEKASITTHRHSKPNMTSDFREMIQMLQPEDLFTSHLTPRETFPFF